MRALVQRVSQASVSVDRRVVGAIGQGMVIFVGVRVDDTTAEADWLAQKCAGLRIFDDAEGRLNLSVLDIGGSALVVSQFTLYADARRGRRPDFIQAARPEEAEPLVQHFVDRLRAEGLPVETGVFRAMMMVEIHNDGPVTILVERESP